MFNASNVQCFSDLSTSVFEPASTVELFSSVQLVGSSERKAKRLSSDHVICVKKTN